MSNFFKNLFPTKKKIDNPLSKNDTYIDIIVSLNKDFSINVNLYLDDTTKNKNLSELEYSLVCAEFLNIIMSGKIEKQITDIIVNQIKNSNNEKLIDNILNFLIIMDKKTSLNTNDETPIIKPSQAFSKYKNG